MDFHLGRFDRERLGFLKRFCPSEAVESIQSVAGENLKEQGVKLVLLDIDNTLMPWHGESIPESTLSWIAEMKKAGMTLCVLSNTRRVERLARITGQMGIDYIRDKFKPSPTMYLIALERYQMKPENAVMIGDQLFTDVWGANRTGIRAIWVKPMAFKEFFGTKISRCGERIIRPFLYKALKGDV